MLLFLLFALLVGGEASEWLSPALTLAPVPSAWLWAGSATILALAARLGVREPKTSWQHMLQLGGLGALAIGLPAVLLLVAQQYFATEVAVAALAGVPVVVAVTTGVLAPEGAGLTDMLLPALTGLAGALLLLPVGLPASLAGWTGFALDLLAVGFLGCFAVLTQRASRCQPFSSTLFAVASGNAVVFAGAAILMQYFGGERFGQGVTPSLRALLMAACVAVLTLLMDTALLRSMRPLGFATRFLLIPSLTAFEGYLFWRPTLAFRFVAGLTMMVAAVVTLLQLKPGHAESVVPSRGLRP